MYTIVQCWINNKPTIPEANCRATGLFKTIEEARRGFNYWVIRLPNNGCEILRMTEEKISFLSPDGKTRGFAEIQEIL